MSSEKVMKIWWNNSLNNHIVVISQYAMVVRELWKRGELLVQVWQKLWKSGESMVKKTAFNFTRVLTQF